MEVLLWLMLGLIGYTYAGYPVLLVLLSRVINRPIRRDPEYRPTVTILVCAFNEGEIIGEKVRNCLELEYPEGQLEIAVASDGSSDRTAEIVAGFADRGVKLFDYKVNRGKVLTLNETTYRDTLNGAGIDNAFLPPAYAWFVRDVDGNSDGAPDPHPVLGSAGFTWHTPILFLVRAQTAAEKSARIPQVMLIGAVLNQF